MRCYRHPDRDAIAVCVGCGRGICEDCATKIGGKFYCKECAEKLFEHPPHYVPRMQLEKKRSASITIAAILFFIIGILDVIGSLLMIAGGGSVSSIPIFGFFSGVLMFLGFIILIFGVLEIVAGHWLWHSLRKGGTLGIILAVLGVLASTILILLVPPIASIEAIDIIINVVLIILIAVGWNTLY